jgi:hypothetical protein
MLGAFVDHRRRIPSSLVSALSVVFSTHPAWQPIRSNTTSRSLELLTIPARATGLVHDLDRKVSVKAVAVSISSKFRTISPGGCERKLIRTSTTVEAITYLLLPTRLTVGPPYSIAVMFPSPLTTQHGLSTRSKKVTTAF